MTGRLAACITGRMIEIPKVTLGGSARDSEMGLVDLWVTRWDWVRVNVDGWFEWQEVRWSIRMDRFPVWVFGVECRVYRIIIICLRTPLVRLKRTGR